MKIVLNLYIFDYRFPGGPLSLCMCVKRWVRWSTNNFPVSLGMKSIVGNMGRLDVKLGLGVGCLVGCQVWAEIFGLRSECLFLDLVLRSDEEICTIGSLRSINLRPYFARNFLTPERKNFVVTSKIKLTKGLALLLWFRCMQFVFEELISITRATIYCDEFQLYKVCVNRDPKNAS